MRSQRGKVYRLLHHWQLTYTHALLPNGSAIENQTLILWCENRGQKGSWGHPAKYRRLWKHLEWIGYTVDPLWIVRYWQNHPGGGFHYFRFLSLGIQATPSNLVNPYRVPIEGVRVSGVTAHPFSSETTNMTVTRGLTLMGRVPRVPSSTKVVQ